MKTVILTLLLTFQSAVAYAEIADWTVTQIGCVQGPVDAPKLPYQVGDRIKRFTLWSIWQIGKSKGVELVATERAAVMTIAPVIHEDLFPCAAGDILVIQLK